MSVTKAQAPLPERTSRNRPESSASMPRPDGPFYLVVLEVTPPEPGNPPRPA